MLEAKGWKRVGWTLHLLNSKAVAEHSLAGPECEGHRWLPERAVESLSHGRARQRVAAGSHEVGTQATAISR